MYIAPPLTIRHNPIIALGILIVKDKILESGRVYGVMIEYLMQKSAFDPGEIFSIL
jgi:hypothetical protein